MKVVRHIPQVAILLSTSLGWGRDIVNGILSYAQEAGPWNIWIRPNSPSVFEHIPPGWHGDGVIARVGNESLAEELAAIGLPVVNVDDSPAASFSGPSFLTDDQTGTRMAADYFIERGFRSIAMAGSYRTPVLTNYAAAFRQVLAEYGIPWLFFDLQGDRNETKPELIKWLQALPKPTGLLGCGVSGAAWIVTCCQEAGISVPHDIAVLSSRDDKMLCHSCFPPLSGIIAPTEQIGYQAAARLHQMMQGEAVSNDPVRLPPLGIIERLSTEALAVKDPNLAKVMLFLRKHAFEPITMADILKEVPMSRRSLERHFVDAFKRTPIEEIRRLRTNKARELLAGTDLPMAQIAEMCGYANYNYLSHAFKTATGLAPSAYRKQFR